MRLRDARCCKPPWRLKLSPLMALNPDQIGKIIMSRLKLVGREDLSCPVCGSDDWQVSSGNVAKGLIPVGGERLASVIDAPKNYPVIWLKCANCAHTLFFGKKALDSWGRELELEDDDG